MSLPYDVKVFQACQRLNPKVTTASGSGDSLVTTDDSGVKISLDKTALEAEIKKGFACPFFGQAILGSVSFLGNLIWLGPFSSSLLLLLLSDLYYYYYYY